MGVHRKKLLLFSLLFFRRECPLGVLYHNSLHIYYVAVAHKTPFVSERRTFTPCVWSVIFRSINKFTSAFSKIQELHLSFF